MATFPKLRIPDEAHVGLKFDDAESIETTIPRQMGFLLQKGQGGSYDYQAYDDASRSIVDLVRAAGFHIDPQTLEITFEKDDWSGPFGAYVERPGQSRPAFTIGVEHGNNKPILAPREYTAGVGSGQAAFPERITGAVQFNSVLYVCIYGRKVYKMENWGTPGAAYFTEVFEHSDSGAILRDLRVHDETLYVAAGSTAAYAYSTDGSSWTECNRTGDDQKLAEQFMVLNGVLHKFRGNSFHAFTSDGKNGGTDWTEAQVGDSSDLIQMMVGLEGGTWFAKEGGIIHLDNFENPLDIYPELQTLRDTGNGWHAFVWNNALFYPTLHGELTVYRDGRPYQIAPALQQEWEMEVTPRKNAVFTGRIRAMAGTQRWLFGEIQRASDNRHRILALEDRPPAGWLWRTMIDLDTTTSDELWITSPATSGPVLWASTSDDRGYKASYWILPAGPQPLQDSRLRYTPAGTLEEPWLDMGCKTIPKRWADVELETRASAACEIEITAYGDDDSIGIKRRITVGPGLTSTVLRFAKGFHPCRCRLVFALITSDATVTPVLVSYRVHAFALPPPVRVFEFTAVIPGSGGSLGAYSQSQQRTFLDRVRRVQYPLTFRDPFRTEWPVIPFPPPPTEVTAAYDRQEWKELWHLALIEQRHREDELGEDELPPEEEFPRLPSYEGRVYIIGQTKAGVPVFGKTEDFSAPSPTWTALSITGLPNPVADDAVYEPAMFSQPSPHAHDSVGMTTMVVAVRASTTDWELYINTDINNTGSTWVKILDRTIAETYHTPLYNGNDPNKFFIFAPRFTIAQEGKFACAVTWESAGDISRVSDRLIFYCDDIDTNPTNPTWQISNELLGWTNDEVTDPVCELQIGQHNPNIMYAIVAELGGLSLGHCHYLSTDGGATFSMVRKESGGFMNDDGCLFIPYEGNEADMICYFKMGTDRQDHLEKTLDGWTTFIDTLPAWPPQCTPDYFEYPLKFDIFDSAKAVWADAAANSIEKTADGFATTVATAGLKRPHHRDCIQQVQEGWIFAHQATSGSDATHILYFSADWVNDLVNKTGDVNDLFGAGGGASWHYKGVIRGLWPDTLSA